MKAHRQVIRGATWNLIGYAVAGLGALILPIVLIKSIGREAYGVYSYITLLLTQSYLLLLGLGEALAYHLATYRSEAIYWVRQALGAALFTGAMGSGLWLWRGPEILIALLGLESFWQGVLLETRFLTGLALMGYEVAILLGWVPLALGWHQRLVLLPLGQLAAQVILPVSAVVWKPLHMQLLFEVSMYGGIGLGMYMWIAISLSLKQPLWPIVSWPAWRTLWRQGLWQSLAQWNGLLLNFFERTIIGRWASLSYMGLYSAGQYFSSKAFQVLYKAVESLLPSFGCEISIWRRHLRLGQSVWFVAFTSAPALLLLHGAGLVLFPHFITPWTIKEMRLWGGIIYSTQLVFVSAPLMPFFISSGRFRVFYLYSLCVVLCQVIATLGLVPLGYYYWAPAIGMICGLGFLTGTVFRRGGVGTLWRAWVLWPLMRLILAWGIVLGPLVPAESYSLMMHLACSLLGASSYFLGERYSLTWPRKRDFLVQVGQALLGFFMAKLIGISRWVFRHGTDSRGSNLNTGRALMRERPPAPNP